VELYLHSPSTPSWRGAKLKLRDKFASIFRQCLSGVRVPARGRNFSLHRRVQTRSGSHPPSYPVGTRGFFSLRVKRPSSEADNSAPSSAEVQNVWNYTSTPQYVFIAWCSDETQGQLYLLPIYPPDIEVMQRGTLHLHFSTISYSVNVNDSSLLPPNSTLSLLYTSLYPLHIFSLRFFVWYPMRWVCSPHHFHTAATSYL